MRDDDVRPLGEEVRTHLHRLGADGGAGDLAAGWAAAVGGEIARNAWPARVRADGTLVVHVRDSVWGFELTQRAEEIRARLPGAPRLRFVPGPLPDAKQAPAVDRGPVPTAEQKHEAEQVAASIADDRLRALVARTVASSLARTAADRPV
jgi:hypothetical protein